MLKYKRLKLKKESKSYQEEKEEKKRVINKTPYKILDAPNLQDDFYLNLVDWSVQNMLGVALNNSVYLWNGNNNKVNKLMESSQNISSINWSKKGNIIGIGMNDGKVQLFDINKQMQIQEYDNVHSLRVSSLSFNSCNILATGSRDKSISILDIR